MVAGREYSCMSSLQYRKFLMAGASLMPFQENYPTRRGDSGLWKPLDKWFENERKMRFNKEEAKMFIERHKKYKNLVSTLKTNPVPWKSWVDTWAETWGPKSSVLQSYPSWSDEAFAMSVDDGMKPKEPCPECWAQRFSGHRLINWVSHAALMIRVQRLEDEERY